MPVVYEDDIEDRRPYMAHDDWCGEWRQAPDLGDGP
jgi:hypothetical protein